MFKIGQIVLKYSNIIIPQGIKQNSLARCISSYYYAKKFNNHLQNDTIISLREKYALPLSIGNTINTEIPIDNKRISRKEINELPLLPQKIIENPINSLLNEINDIIKRPNTTNEILTPPASQHIEKHAARLVVIRKRKMKKHKLRKLRKKMKFEWAKVRQRREMRKEKAFQAELLMQIKEAEKFSAEQYVSEKLRKANEIPIPRFWKGKRLPQFIIKQKLGIE